MTIRPTRRRWWLLILALGSAPTCAAEPLFEFETLSLPGRIVTAHAADFSGDGRTDLMLVTLDGVPPAETRVLSLFEQAVDGRFPADPTRSMPLPTNGAVYDAADVKAKPGVELLVLRPDSVRIVSLADDSLQHWDLIVPGPTTLAAASDERGFDRMRLVYDGFGPTAWILAPQLGALTALTADGTVVAQIDPGRRANYFVQKPTAIVSVESDIQLYFDAPKVSVGDVDGDGENDIVTTTRHEARVFLRGRDGQFPRQPSRTHALGFINREDHSRGSGSVVPQPRDIDGDGRLDLLITHVAGSFTKSTTTSYVYRNRSGQWNLAAPDDRFVDEGVWNSDLLMSLDTDRQLELVRIQFRFSVLEMVELLLTRKLDAQIEIHRLADGGRFDSRPWSRQKVSIGLSFDTFRPKGFMPTGGMDLNGDGLKDFVTSANGKGIQIYLGGDKGPFANRPVSQKFPSTGVIRFSDLNGDGLTDFLLYDPQTFDGSIRLGRNLGNLPTRSR